jgi:hypothetical protein
VLLAYLIVRQAGWRALTATALAGAVPLTLYLGWYDARYHRVAFNESAGIFLWSRTMTFADCAVIKPQADLRPLCPRQPVAGRPAAPYFIWDPHSLLLSVGGTGTEEFTPKRNALAQKFAIAAIRAQPLAYSDAVLRGLAFTFDWNRPAYPSAQMAARYQFTTATQNSVSPGIPGPVTAKALAAEQREYTGGDLAATRQVQPFANFMISYQRFIYLRGTMIGLLMLIGLAGIARSWRGSGFRKLRGWGGPALFPWLTALTMMLVPPATAAFSLRYVVPTVPVVCLAAALAFARPRPGPDVVQPDVVQPDVVLETGVQPAVPLHLPRAAAKAPEQAEDVLP